MFFAGKEKVGNESPAGVSEEAKRRFRPRVLIVGGLLSLILATAFSYWFRNRGVTDEPIEAEPIVVTTDTPEDILPVMPDTPVLTISPSDATYESENFRVGEIAIGGELALIVPEDDPTPLEILSVRGEAFSEKGGSGTKLILTWETSKPAMSDIAYGRGVGSAEAVVREETYGTNHSVIIPGLAQATTYVYVITTRDKWGNEVESDPYAVYTGSREVSLFELIAGAVGDVFGWTVD